MRVGEKDGESRNWCGVVVRGGGARSAGDEAEGCGCYDYAAGLTMISAAKGEDVVGVCCGAAVDEGVGVKSCIGRIDVACSTR